MKDKKYQYLLYVISTVIAITLAIQVYWNYKNYKESERELRIDLQTALDQSVEDYFTLRAKNNTISFFGNGSKDFKISELLKSVDFENLDDNDELILPDTQEIDGVTILRGVNADTMKRFQKPKLPTKAERFFKNATDSINKLKDSTKTDVRITNLRFSDEKGTTEIEELTNRIVFSIKSDKIKIEKLDSIFKNQLAVKNIPVKHVMIHKDFKEIDSTIVSRLKEPMGNEIVSQSELINENEEVSITYFGVASTLLKRNLTGILLSTLLIAAVILCLFYLLAIIKKQKALSIMKNDLISNITHEFKTPIATASAALEGVQSFTASGDLEKTNRYLSMSREQLHKLHGMVEKLLDTATLDSQELVLQKSDIELESLIADSVSKFQERTSKQINYEVFKDTTIHADVFHLENALSNLIDNAIKYGGDEITINAYTDKSDTIITIKDSGTNLKKSQEKLLFDQFYRVPKGNQHDVKGFGIGLYYTKSIIEKHNGTIELITAPSTTFKITLPNG